MPSTEDIALTPAGGVRSGAREQMRRVILDAGRARLATEGPDRLSLRAVARDVGVVSSAVYRYVANRDALLTALIVESYDALGEAAEAAEEAVDRLDFAGRFLAAGLATGGWGRAHPHEWALVFGSPIPGYAAPEDTIVAAARIPTLLVRLLADARAAGVPLPAGEVEREVVASMGPLLEFFGDAAPAESVVRGMMAWSSLVGSVSQQVFGHRHNVISDDGGVDFFAGELRRTAAFLGLGPTPTIAR
jgi:AcrR family transcriptional regulator